MTSQTHQILDSGIGRLEDSPLLNMVIPQEDADQLYLVYPNLAKNHNIGCPACGKNAGQNTDGYVMLQNGWWQCNCRDQLQRHKHYLNAGIGSTYQYLDWNNYVGSQDALAFVLNYVRNLDDNVDAGIGFSLTSEHYGTGKSMLASLVLKECVKRGYICFSTTYADMLASMKSGWHDPIFAKWYKQKVDSAQVLMIDDIGKELSDEGSFNTGMSQVTLDSILRTRSQQNRPTFFTSNYGAADIGSAYGGAVLSLMKEQGEMVSVHGEDYREKFVRPMRGFRRVY